MNVTLWILQVLLALHTVTGAIWKFSHAAEQTMPSLKAIPDAAWMGLIVVELLCSVGLVLPALRKHLGHLVPIAASVIAGEMLLFCAVHLASGAADHGPMMYWLVVAGLCGFTAYGRRRLAPLAHAT